MQLEEAKEICKSFVEENKDRPIILHTAIETVLQALDNLKQENTKLKASHIITRNEATDKEKAELFDIIDSTIDTYLNNTKPYWKQIMNKDKMSIEEAEQIIDEMYQDRNKIIEADNVIDVSKLDDVKFTNLEFASVRVLREIQALRRALDSSIPIQVVEEKIKEYERRKEGLNDIEASVRLDVKIRAYKELLKESK